MDAERIPDDIKVAAYQVVERGYSEGLLEAVEKALLAERERCAQIVEAHDPNLNAVTGDFTAIAYLIRTPSPATSE